VAASSLTGGDPETLAREAQISSFSCSSGMETAKTLPQSLEEKSIQIHPKRCILENVSHFV